MFSDDDRFILCCGSFLINGPQRKKPRYWVSSLLKRRNNYDTEELLHDLKTDDVGLNGELRSSFHNFTRMTSIDFEVLINLVGPKIAKQNTNFRDAISVKDRLAVTLRFLASGDSFQSLKYLFKISNTAISRIIPDVCEALYDALQYYIEVSPIINNLKHSLI